MTGSESESMSHFEWGDGRSSSCRCSLMCVIEIRQLLWVQWLYTRQYLFELHSMADQTLHNLHLSSSLTCDLHSLGIQPESEVRPKHCVQVQTQPACKHTVNPAVFDAVNNRLVILDTTKLSPQLLPARLELHVVIWTVPK